MRSSPATSRWIALSLGAAATAAGAVIWELDEPPRHFQAPSAAAPQSSAAAHGGAPTANAAESSAAAIPDAQDTAPAALESAPDSGPTGDYGLRNDLRVALDRYRQASDADERWDALLDLALADQPEVLPFLLDELLRAEPAARAPVLEALIQYGSREAIPALRKLAERVSTSEERQALVKAADYLALPTFTELRRGQLPPAPTSGSGTAPEEER